ncbi:hypothetical protein [Thermoanaerobacterium sp. DL9XJH110]|jgi:hypothetical protein|uniref:hypothetical protein n=1 Tax=Thermoanaerobacterium sp. DL9XJH110 TaxID=3386643 RepID=UPI003BB67EC0
MLIDIIGILLTILIISPRYWNIVFLISCADLLFSVCISLVLQSRITEVIAGGIFSSITWPGGKSFLTILGPLFLLTIGLGLAGPKEIPWLDLINPLAGFRKPWPVIMIKLAVFRMLVFLYFLAGK